MTWEDGTTTVRSASELESKIRAGMPFVDLERKPYNIDGGGSEPDGEKVQLAIDTLSARARPGGLIIVPPNANLGVGESIQGRSNIRMTGANRDTSRLTRLDDVIVLDLSGTGPWVSGKSTHVRKCAVEHLTISGAYNHSWTQPLVRAYYSDSHRFNCVDHVGSYGECVRAVELWDSTWFNCRFDDSGGIAGSNLPAVNILGRDGASGFGYTADNSNVLNFISCWWESNRAGSFWVRHNGNSNPCNQIRLIAPKMEAGGSVAGVLFYVDSVMGMHIHDLYGYMGGFLTGYSTPTDFMQLWGMQFSTIDGVFLAASAVASLVRAAVSFRGNCTGTSIDRVYGSHPAAPTVGLVEFSGSNAVEVGKAIRYQQNTGGSPLFVGHPAVPWELRGNGTPEGVVGGVVGSRFLRLDDGAASTLYVKESGTGRTGWAAK